MTRNCNVMLPTFLLKFSAEINICTIILPEFSILGNFTMETHHPLQLLPWKHDSSIVCYFVYFLPFVLINVVMATHIIPVIIVSHTIYLL